MKSEVYITALISAIAAGSASTAATVLIEKLGGSIGGVIASSPSTIVIFGVATAVTADTSYDLVTTLYMSAVGLFGDAIFLWLWRELPSTRYMRRVGTNKYTQAAVLTLLTIGFWTAYAVAMIFVIQPLLSAGVPNRVIGAFFWLSNICFGLYAVLFCYVPPPEGRQKVGLVSYLGRFALGACSIGIAIAISSINVVAGGVGSMFPNTFLVSMLTLRLSHGQELPHSAIGPLMLGSVASPFFAAMMAELLHPLQSAVGSHTGGIALTAAVAEVVAVLCVSVPVYCIVLWRRRKHLKEDLCSIRNSMEVVISSSHSRATAGL